MMMGRPSRSRVWLSLLALALIIFVPLESPPPPPPPPPSDRQIGSEWPAREHYSNHARRELAARRAPAGIRLASGAYLDQVGQMSHVMNELIDSLLEKVSFLADIIIESSLAEECEQVADLPGVCRRRPGSRPRDLAELLANKSFDEKEFTDVNLFVTNFNEMYREPSRQRRSGCKLFTLDIQARDLPADEMETCCGSFGLCYQTCGRLKQTCDLQFRQCLKSVCKHNFDYTNATVRERYRKLDRRRAPLFSEEPLEGELDEDEEQAELYRELMNEVRPTGTRKLNKRSAGQSASNNNNNNNADHDDDDELADGQNEQPAGGDAATMRRLKDKYKACRLASKLLIIGNLAFGCQTYKQSQWRACCEPPTDNASDTGAAPTARPN